MAAKVRCGECQQIVNVWRETAFRSNKENINVCFHCAAERGKNFTRWLLAAGQEVWWGVQPLSSFSDSASFHSRAAAVSIKNRKKANGRCIASTRNFFWHRLLPIEIVYSFESFLLLLSFFISGVAAVCVQIFFTEMYTSGFTVTKKLATPEAID